MSIQGRDTMDHERVAFNLARIKKHGKHFEVAVDPDLAIRFRNGEALNIKEVLKSEKIFTDVKKGLLAEEKVFPNVFNTANSLDVAKIILQEGEIHLTAEYRQKLRDEKRKKIVTLICRNAIDPKSKLPHPPTRIENAMQEAKVKIDEYKAAEEQIDGIVVKLQPIIPIRMETKKIEVHIPSEFAGKAYGAIARFAKPQNETWNNDGSYDCMVELPAGLEPDFYEKMNNLTHGGLQAKVIEKK